MVCLCRCFPPCHEERRVVNLPPTEKMRAAGFDKPKPPKLEECIRHFFNEELGGAHDAMIDLDACRRVYIHLASVGAAK